MTFEPDEGSRIAEQAAERGVRKLLAELGLDNGGARDDNRDLRSLLDALRLARRIAWQTTVRILTTVFLAALFAWVAIRLKFWGE